MTQYNGIYTTTWDNDDFWCQCCNWNGKRFQMSARDDKKRKETKYYCPKCGAYITSLVVV